MGCHGASSGAPPVRRLLAQALVELRHLVRGIHPPVLAEHRLDGAVRALGRSNAAIAARLFVTEKAVSKHINNIFANLGLPPSDDDHRRVLAVLAYLNA
jgi:hypothetical protein